MKRLLGIVLAVIIGFGIAWVAASKYESSRAAAAFREKEKALQQEKDLLASQLRDAQTKLANTKEVFPRTEIVEVTKKLSPKEIIALLQTLRIGSKDTKNIRLAIQPLENLIALGESALPEIETFLATQ